MTIDEIKSRMAASGLTCKQLADDLSVNADSLRQILNGNREIKDQLRKHIELLLSQPQYAVLVYKVDLSDKQVLDLTSGKQFPDTPEGRQRMMDALEAVISHNIRRLAALGRECAWTPEERRWLQLDEPQQDGSDYTQREQKPFA